MADQRQSRKRASSSPRLATGVAPRSTASVSVPTARDMDRTATYGVKNRTGPRERDTAREAEHKDRRPLH